MALKHSYKRLNLLETGLYIHFPLFVTNIAVFGTLFRLSQSKNADISVHRPNKHIVGTRFLRTNGIMWFSFHFVFG